MPKNPLHYVVGRSHKCEWCRAHDALSHRADEENRTFATPASPFGCSNYPCINALESSLSRNQPTISSDESKRIGYNLLIRLATYPAPKPLSIFTTVTLLAQLLSMPSSAARP